jgi:hypothetical protein
VFVHVVLSSVVDACVHVTPSVIMSIVLALCITYWCRPLCTLSRFVHIVSCSMFDAVVHMTPSVTVLVVSVVVLHLLVPPFVHVYASSACSQLECV